MKIGPTGRNRSERSQNVTNLFTFWLDIYMPLGSSSDSFDRISLAQFNERNKTKNTCACSRTSKAYIAKNALTCGLKMKRDEIENERRGKQMKCG